MPCRHPIQARSIEIHPLDALFYLCVNHGIKGLTPAQLKICFMLSSLILVLNVSTISPFKHILPFSACEHQPIWRLIPVRVRVFRLVLRLGDGR